MQPAHMTNAINAPLCFTPSHLITSPFTVNQDDYCYMPYRAFEKSYDRLRVNMSPAMTGTL